jgi:hypothetical protein
VTDVHWWGSYGNNLHNPPASFWIGFWSDKPGAVPSQPAQLLKSYIFPFAAANETFFGDQERFPIGQEKIKAYQYFVDLLPDPFLEEKDVTYWLSIQALGTADWGWKTGFPQWRDDSILASGIGLGAPQITPPPPVGSPWPPSAVAGMAGLCFPQGVVICLAQVDPATNATVDMAFELTTVPGPSGLLLVGIGLAGLGLLQRRRRR